MFIGQFVVHKLYYVRQTKLTHLHQVQLDPTLQLSYLPDSSHSPNRLYFSQFANRDRVPTPRKKLQQKNKTKNFPKAIIPECD